MKPRIKHRQMPGDVPKKTKIRMLEKPQIEPARSKSFKKEIRMRERAVLKEHTRQYIELMTAEGLCTECGEKHDKPFACLDSFAARELAQEDRVRTTGETEQVFPELGPPVFGDDDE